MGTTNTDRIEDKVMLRAPRARVWRALTDAEEFGMWFGVKLAGSFVPGGTVRGKVLHKGYEHVPFEIVIDRMEPERLLSWRWHPGAVDSGVDYSDEPTTLVEFQLEETPGGTVLTVVESGFNRIPAARREEAYRGDEEGWAWQMKSIEQHLRKAA